MIEYVGFNVASEPEEPGSARRVPLDWPMLVMSPSAATGGVAWIAPGERSLAVTVDMGYPAITASLINADADLGVSGVSLDGSGTATIVLNRLPSSDVQVVWFVVEPSGSGNREVGPLPSE